MASYMLSFLVTNWYSEGKATECTSAIPNSKTHIIKHMENGFP